MKFIVKGTRTVLNFALHLHRLAILKTVDSAYGKAERAAKDVVEQKKFVQLAKERELDLVDVSNTAKQAAKTIDAVAKAELARLPARLA